MSDGLRDYNAEVEVINVDEAEKLRRAGKTYAEIGKYFGCSRQAVQQKLSSHKRNRRRYQDIFEACPYVGLRKYMLKHPKLTISGLSIAVFGCADNKMLMKTHRMLNGSNTILSIENVKTMENLTGMPFAELFRREDA
jgi:hypothetical protein